MQSSILRRASPLMAARLGVAAITFVIPMVLARVLLPASYGTFKQAWLLASTLFTVLPLGLTPSLVYFVPRDPERKHHYIAQVLLLTTLLGAVAGGILLYAGPLVARLFHNPELLPLVPLIAWFSAMRLAGVCWDVVYMSEGRIKQSAFVRIFGEGLYALCLVSFALWTRSVYGAFLGMCISSTVRAVLCWIMVVRRHGLRLDRELLLRQLAYALPFGAAFAIIIPQRQFHSFLVSAKVSAAAFAVYSVGCLQLPVVDMLYTPISEILQLGIAEHDARHDNPGALQLFREAVSKLSFVFVPTMAVLFVCAPELIRFLFTDRYAAAVPLFRVAMISIPLAALPLDGVMRARAQNKFMFWNSVLKLALTVPFVFFGFRFFGMMGALGGWVVAEESCRMVLLFRAARLFEVPVHRALPAREIAFQVLSALLAAPAAALALAVDRGVLFFRLAACGIVFAATYLLVMRLCGQVAPLRSFLPRRAVPAAA